MSGQLAKNPDDAALKERFAKTREAFDEKTLALIKHKLAVNPTATATRYEYGVYLVQHGQFAEAIAELQTAQQDESIKSDCALAIAFCFEKLKKHKLAMTNYETAIRLLGNKVNEPLKRALYGAARLSAVLGQICAMSDLTTAQQQQVSLIQVKIEELEAAIERETTTAADRKESLDKKRQLEDDAQKELKAAEEAGDEEAIAAAKEKLAGLQGEIDALNDEIATIDARVEDRKKEVEGCGRDISDLLAKFDYPALVLVLAAITVSASDMVPAADANPDDEEKEKLKIPSPLDIVRESLEKAFEDICEEIAEKRMETV